VPAYTRFAPLLRVSSASARPRPRLAPALSDRKITGFSLFLGSREFSLLTVGKCLQTTSDVWLVCIFRHSVCDRDASATAAKQFARDERARSVAERAWSRGGQGRPSAREAGAENWSPRIRVCVRWPSSQQIGTLCGQCPLIAKP